MSKKTPADVVIEELGVRPLARILDLDKSTVSRWRVSGMVPSAYHRDIISHADGKITAEDLVFGRE